MRRSTWALAAVFAALGSAGCAWSNGQSYDDIDPPDHAIARRHGAGLVEGCAVAPAEMTLLASADAKRMLDEIVLLCGAAGPDGHVAPSAPDARAALTGQIDALHALGYHVSFGVSFRDATGAPLPSYDLGRLLAQDPARSILLADVEAMGATADDLALDLRSADMTLRHEVGDFLEDLRRSRQPGQTMSVMTASTVTFDLTLVEPWIDRLRVLTIEHLPGGSGWAVDAVRAATGTPDCSLDDDADCPVAPPPFAGAVDVALPLFGLHAAPQGMLRVSAPDAFALASAHGASLSRDVQGVLSFTYEEAGKTHIVWFRDAAGNLLTMRAWEAPVLDPRVGVTYYGLGAEDPQTWSALARSLRP